ncbi:MAG: peptidase dimerization domain protein, partial [Mucinivorans sp.]
MKATQQYIEQNKDRFLSQLFELLRIESISSIASHKADMDSAAQWLATRLRQAGADTATIYPTAGPSIVYGQKIIDPAFPTILIYGHYDVMPV